MTAQILTQNAAARNRYQTGQTSPQTTTEILAAFDDLYQHHDFDAAALALGDAWLTLSPINRQRIVDLVKEIGG
ncbi:MAG: hypothetical protein FOGNACKC_01971 [Anaerolineae bacterium]|nr:hypothetical protein [Anaerolineae bacterium]